MRASKKVKGAVLLTAGAALVLGAPSVYADTDTGRNDGLLNGLQVLNGASLNIPVNACGVAALLATAKGECESEAGNGNGGNSIGRNGVGRAGDGGGTGDVSSKRNDGLLNGAQVGNNLTANVPVNACGVGALLGSGRGKCEAKAGDNNGGDSKGGGGGHGKRGKAGDGADQGDVSTSRNDGLLNGVQALNNVSLNVPVNLCGVGLLLADGRGKCEAEAGNGNGGDLLGRGGRGGRAGDGGAAGDTRSSRNSGLLNGLQLLNNLDANVPVTVCGLAVLGSARCSVDVESGNRNGGDVYRGGHDGGHKTKVIKKTWKTWKHHDNDHDDHDSDHKRSWKSSALPHTGAAGLALLPFGLALIAGGAAMRRRSITSQR